MYDLRQTAHDFPWTAVKENAIEPWREVGSNWFDELPEGWGDVIHECLTKIEATLDHYGLKGRFVIEQVKEKWGTLRLYYYVKDDDGFAMYLDHPAIKEIDDTIETTEQKTARICCFCGTKTDVHGYGGWVHYACTSCEDEYQRRLYQ